METNNVQGINVLRCKQASCFAFFSPTTKSKYRPEDEAAEGAAAPKLKDGAAAGEAALAEAPKIKG